MTQPLVSIIIAAYNVEKWISECLESVKHQTYDNWECLIINDGSTDRTPLIAEKHSAYDSRFRLINKENGGVSSARNLGLDEANGEYVYFIDGDDKIAPECIEYCINNIVDADILAFDCIAIRSSGEVIRNTDQGVERILNQQEALTELFRRSILSGVWSKFYKRSIIKNVRFDLNLAIAEDLLYNARVILNNPRISVKITNECLYFYRILKKSATHGVNQNRIEQLYKQIVSMEHLYCLYSNEIDQNCLDAFANNIISDALSHYEGQGFIKKTDRRFIPILKQWGEISSGKWMCELVNSKPMIFVNIMVSLIYLPNSLKRFFKSILSVFR